MNVDRLISMIFELVRESGLLPWQHKINITCIFMDRLLLINFSDVWLLSWQHKYYLLNVLSEFQYFILECFLNFWRCFLVPATHSMYIPSTIKHVKPVLYTCITGFSSTCICDLISKSDTFMQNNFDQTITFNCS